MKFLGYFHSYDKTHQKPFVYQCFYYFSSVFPIITNTILKVGYLVNKYYKKGNLFSLGTKKLQFYTQSFL